MLFRHVALCSARAAHSGGEQAKGHEEDEEQLPAEVQMDILKQRASKMFSGESGGVVPSGYSEATSAPSYGLINNVIEVVDALPHTLFDRSAEHRPCGLLDRYDAYGMLLGDVLGRPLLPWELAKPIGSAAAKLKKKIPEKKKEAKKKAKRAGRDPDAAAAAVLRRGAPLELPSADAIKATARRIAKAALLPPDAPPPEAEALPPEAPPPELPPPAPAPEPAACSAEEPCPIFRALIDAAMSDESKPVILWAFHIAALRRAVSIASREWSLGDVDVDDTMEELDVAEIHLGYALRRLLRAYPTEFGGRITKGSKATCVIGLIVMLESGGHSVPVAVQAADAVGFNLAKVARESAPQKCE
jgi:hypothetical protein